jgi:sporulation protein YlmC with PRC-barrel domain
MITENPITDIKDRDVYGSDGEKIGRVGVVYLDDDSGRPEWVTINTGLFGTKTSFAPLANAEVIERGLSVPFDKATVKDAPNVAPMTGIWRPRKSGACTSTTASSTPRAMTRPAPWATTAPVGPLTTP